MLAMGGHGVTLVSAKDAKCHRSETLEQVLSLARARTGSLYLSLSLPPSLSIF